MYDTIHPVPTISGVIYLLRYPLLRSVIIRGVKTAFDEKQGPYEHVILRRSCVFDFESALNLRVAESLCPCDVH